jgi:PAS domain S-box-containing protein
MTAKARPRGLEHFKILVHDFSEGVVEGKLRTDRLTSSASEAGPSDHLEALDELRRQQEELAVADEEMRMQLEELSGANARVHGERDRYRELFDVAPDAYFITDHVGAIRDVNPEASRMLGIEARFLAGKPLAVLVDAADTRVLRGAMSALATTTTSTSLEIRFKPRTGKPRWHTVKGVNVEQNTAVLWIARDIQAHHEEADALASTNSALGENIATRTRELERANRDNHELLERERRLRKQLEDEHAAKDRLLTMLSRDLRVPINAVLGWTQLLRREKLDENARNRGLAMIERNASAQLRLLEELLDISRFGPGSVQLERIPVDLRALAQRGIEAIAAEANERGVAVRTALAAERVLVPGDRRRLEQVLANLLSNALKFTPRGGSVTVALEHDDTTATLVVTDTGRGIPTDVLPHVFAAFQRRATGDSSASDDGTGLGLYIAQQLVDAHGGRIVAESDGASAGSRFVVSLPLARHAAARPVAEPAPAISPRAGALEGVRVLVLDDDADSRELTATVLRLRGAVVAVASDVDAALHAFAVSPPDVLVSVVAMTGRSGLDRARQLRAHPTATTALVAVSGFTSPEQVAAALDAGFDLHLAKPVEPQELVDAVREAARLRGR